MINVLLLVLLYAVGACLWYLLRWGLSVMAQYDILFTYRTEGEIKAIMIGDKCDHYVMAVENHFIDPLDFDIYKGSLEKGLIQDYMDDLVDSHVKMEKKVPRFVDLKLTDLGSTTPANTSRKFPARKGRDGHWYTLREEFARQLCDANRPTFIERWFGVTWVGLPPYKVFKYQFRWIKYAQKKVAPGEPPSDQIIMGPRDELVDSLYFNYPVYGFVLSDLDTGVSEAMKAAGEMPERIGVILNLVVETQTKNPQKTLFRTAGLSSAGDWLSAISRAIRHDARGWVGQTDYDTLTREKDEIQRLLEKTRKKVNKGVRVDGRWVSAIETYGQEIVKIELVNVDLKDQSLQAAINSVFTAEQTRRARDKEAAGRIRLADAGRKEAAAPILGEADGYKEIAEIPNGAGVKIAIAKRVGNIKVLSTGGSGANIIRLPESLLEENPSSAAPPAPTVPPAPPAPLTGGPPPTP